jgi:hypothetical protein
MARTAVVAGTATAVAGGVNRRQNARADAAEQDQAAQQAAFDSQAELADMQAQMAAMQAQQGAPAAAPDLTTELEKLAGLHSSGVLTDEEFAAAKARLLA